MGCEQLAEPPPVEDSPLVQDTPAKREMRQRFRKRAQAFVAANTQPVADLERRLTEALRRRRAARRACDEAAVADATAEVMAVGRLLDRETARRVHRREDGSDRLPAASEPEAAPDWRDTAVCPVCLEASCVCPIRVTKESGKGGAPAQPRPKGERTSAGAGRARARAGKMVARPRSSLLARYGFNGLVFVLSAPIAFGLLVGALFAETAGGRVACLLACGVFVAGIWLTFSTDSRRDD